MVSKPSSPHLSLRRPSTSMTNFVLETDKRLSKEAVFSYEALPNETKLTHTYLPTYVPNKTAPNERGGEGRASL